MSGGSYNYAYSKLEDLAEEIRIPGSCDAAPAHIRNAFVRHLRKVAAAMKAIEWNDSCDGANDEEELIRACLGGDRAGVAVLIDEADDVMKRLRTETERLRSKGTQ